MAPPMTAPLTAPTTGAGTPCPIIHFVMTPPLRPREQRTDNAADHADSQPRANVYVRRCTKQEVRADRCEYPEHDPDDDVGVECHGSSLCCGSASMWRCSSAVRSSDG